MCIKENLAKIYPLYKQEHRVVSEQENLMSAVPLNKICEPLFKPVTFLKRAPCWVEMVVMSRVTTTLLIGC